MKNVSVIGIGLAKEDLTADQMREIEKADVLFGGRRLLEQFPGFSGEKIAITGRIEDTINAVSSLAGKKRVVVLASGDPLFYGIGSRLTVELGESRVKIYPNITSVAAAFARIKTSWHDARIISLHGREAEKELIEAAEKDDKIAVLTDPARNPAWVAERLIKSGIIDFKMWVAERMGSGDERLLSLRLEEAARKSFHDPNMVVLLKSPDRDFNAGKPFLGMPDSLFFHDRGMITKSEIRAVSISKLRLEPDHVLWDLGAGSGSVSIEASCLIDRGRIIAVEKNEARIRQIMVNKKRFNVANMEVVCAELPDGIEGLPDPDRVFLGGGGAAIESIIDAVDARLSAPGIIVVNAVMLETVFSARKILVNLGYMTELVQVQVARERPIAGHVRLESFNPVFILTGRKEDDRRH